MISIIVAHTKNMVIGKDGGMPWHLPADLQYFKRVTMGKPIIMGRKTFESIGRPLPGRKNIVITKNTDLSLPAGVVKCASIEDAKVLVQNEDAFIIGGGSIYKASIAHADRLYITLIDAEIEGDTYFPKYDLNNYQLIESTEYPQDEKNQYALNFLVYQKK